LCGSAIGLGARRFASADNVGRSWLSATEQIERTSARNKVKWISFALSVLPAPFLGLVYPGPLALRAIVCAAFAAAQAAYSLARVEYTLARAVDAVALKSRCAAVSDTYANQVPQICVCVFIYMLCVYIYICVCISLSFSLSLSIYIYIYICIYRVKG